MPSTDIDGSPIVILSKEEALCVYDGLAAKSSLLRPSPLEQQIIRKIARDLKLEQPAEEQPAEEQPAEEQPAEEQPAEEQPAEEQPAEERPAEERPAEERPEPLKE